MGWLVNNLKQLLMTVVLVKLKSVICKKSVDSPFFGVFKALKVQTY